MSESRLPDYLDQMLEAALQACNYVEGMRKEDFLADKRTQQAVILNLIILGEVATKLLQSHGDFLDHHADVPWRSMKGMRNRIAHGYFDINHQSGNGLGDDTEALPELAARLPSIRKMAGDTAN